MKPTLASFALSILAFIAYVTAGAVFALHLFGVLNSAGDSIAIVPYSIVAGWGLNACGAVVAVIGFFAQKRHRWACAIPFAINAAPPLVVLGLMAVGFVLIG
jgi:hypothetical protein